MPVTEDILTEPLVKLRVESEAMVGVLPVAVFLRSLSDTYTSSAIIWIFRSSGTQIHGTLAGSTNEPLRFTNHSRGRPQKRLFWVAVPGGCWRIDWPRTNRGS